MAKKKFYNINSTVKPFPNPSLAREGNESRSKSGRKGRVKQVLFVICFTALFTIACEKPEPYVNPFDSTETNNEEETNENELDPASIEGLHATIFKPTCANSGCHDGTFEPDFRTIQSTYNTLVNHPIIKNDPQGSFEYRVIPNNVAESQLIARLTYDIDGNSGVMPLALEPDNDWESTSDTHIENIRKWIQNGAKQ